MARGRAFAPLPARAAANDDEPDADARALHRAALRLFERHGHLAADHAQDEANRAFFAGDRQAVRWWLAVSRALDGRIAVEQPASFGLESSSA